MLVKFQRLGVHESPKVTRQEGCERRPRQPVYLRGHIGEHKGLRDGFLTTALDAKFFLDSVSPWVERGCFENQFLETEPIHEDLCCARIGVGAKADPACFRPPDMGVENSCLALQDITQ